MNFLGVPAAPGCVEIFAATVGGIDTPVDIDREQAIGTGIVTRGRYRRRHIATAYPVNAPRPWHKILAVRAVGRLDNMDDVTVRGR